MRFFLLVAALFGFQANASESDYSHFLGSYNLSKCENKEGPDIRRHCRYRCPPKLRLSYIAHGYYGDDYVDIIGPNFSDLIRIETRTFRELDDHEKPTGRQIQRQTRLESVGSSNPTLVTDLTYLDGPNSGEVIIRLDEYNKTDRKLIITTVGFLTAFRGMRTLANCYYDETQ